MLNPSLPELLAGRRMLATDLDGTLLRADHTVSDFTREAIAEAVAAGIEVVFATGRPPRWMRAVADETGHVGEAICANGAVVIDLASEEVLSRATLDVEAAAEVAQELRDRWGGSVSFAVEHVEVGPLPTGMQGFALEDGYQGSLPIDPSARRMPLAELFQQPGLVKLLAKLEHADPEFPSVAARLSGDRLEVTRSTTATLLEFGPAGVTKGTALATLAARLGLRAQDVVAVGDMPNDVPMLSWAGVGLAVSDAHESAKAVALHEIPAPDSDGVGHVLRTMARSQKRH